MQTPILRSLFGQTNDQINQSDIVMLLTPHIVRTHELTVQDLSSIYIGTQQNVGLGGPPPLIAPLPEAGGGVAPGNPAVREAPRRWRAQLAGRCPAVRPRARHPRVREPLQALQAEWPAVSLVCPACPAEPAPLLPRIRPCCRRRQRAQLHRRSRVKAARHRALLRLVVGTRPRATGCVRLPRRSCLWHRLGIRMRRRLLRRARLVVRPRRRAPRRCS